MSSTCKVYRRKTWSISRAQRSKTRALRMRAITASLLGTSRAITIALVEASMQSLAILNRNRVQYQNRSLRSHSHNSRQTMQSRIETCRDIVWQRSWMRRKRILMWSQNLTKLWIKGLKMTTYKGMNSMMLIFQLISYWHNRRILPKIKKQQVKKFF